MNYVDQSTAQSGGLIGTNSSAVYMGVDNTNVASGRGRNSVRLTSKKAYNTGLIILDLAHMPGGACGEWPAFWTVGPNWPTSGEIDIIEGVNSQASNAMALHTSSGCSISAGGAGGAQSAMTGSIATSNCDVNAAGQPNNAGCSIKSADSSSYGTGFNANGGGVYATEWTNSAIKIWFFSRANIPADITSGNPTPASWGTPTAVFGAPCQIGNYFKNQQIVFDVTFCGDWAGNTWSTDATCSAKGSSCQAYVQNTPQAFKESYWSINSLRVYSQAGGASPSAGPNGIPGALPSNVPQGQGWGQGQGQAGNGQGSGLQWGPPQQQPQSPNYNSNIYFNQNQGQSQPPAGTQAQANGNKGGWNQKWGGQGNYYYAAAQTKRPLNARSADEALDNADFQADAPVSTTSPNSLVEDAVPGAAIVARARPGNRNGSKGGYAPYVSANGNLYQGQNNRQGQQAQAQVQSQGHAQQQQQAPPAQPTPAPQAAGANGSRTVTVTRTITSGVVTKTLLARGTAAATGPKTSVAAGRQQQQQQGAGGSGRRPRRAVGMQEARLVSDEGADDVQDALAVGGAGEDLPVEEASAGVRVVGQERLWPQERRGAMHLHHHARLVGRHQKRRAWW